MIKQKSLLIIVVASLLANIALAYINHLQRQESDFHKTEAEKQKISREVANFLNLFIEKVLMSTEEVSFEDRLKLENAIRDLKNKELLSQWERFTGSNTPEQVQEEAKKLLDLLVKQIVL